MFQQVKNIAGFEMVYPILEEAFPVTELRIKQAQQDLLQKELYRLYQIKDEKQEIAGVIAAWELADDFVYIEHFAICPEKRNGGFGGRVLEAFATWYGKNIVLEVELPEDDLTKRRIGFYKRHGFVMNDYPYLQPPMRKGQDFLPLRLMTKPYALDEQTYARYRKLIHENVYGYFVEKI